MIIVISLYITDQQHFSAWGSCEHASGMADIDKQKVSHTWQAEGPLGLKIQPCSGTPHEPKGVFVSKITSEALQQHGLTEKLILYEVVACFLLLSFLLIRCGG